MIYSKCNSLEQMPGTRCTVAVCKNSLQKTKQNAKKSTVTYHRFPKDKAIRKQWVLRCKRGGQWNPDSSHICSEHFLEEDFENAIPQGIEVSIRRYIKKGRIPSQKLKPIEIQNVLPSNRFIRSKEKENKETVDHLLTSNRTESLNINVESTSENGTEDCVSLPNYIVDELKQKIEKLKKENEIHSRNAKRTQNKNKIQNVVIRGLRSELRRMRRFKVPNSKMRKTAIEALETVFTKNQINIILGKNKQAIWTLDEISTALTLRYLSKRAYVYLRKKLKFPLPGISTLQRFSSKLDMRQGILTEVLTYLKVAGQKLTEAERLTTLQFDEVKVKRAFEYDPKTDQVVGPHNYMQVVMARGIVENWKQPLYVGFDQKMTKELLNKIITHLDDVGYRVIACVSDMGGSNVGLWKEMGINIDNSWSPHPVNPLKKVYFFADAPHLLKLIRNWFLDTGFIMGDGSKVDKSFLEELLTKDNNELKICFNVNSNHLEVVKTQRQNVKLAAELLSHTTACALRRYILDQKVKSTVDLIELINNWFDIMNSYVEGESNIPTKQAYGKSLEKQNVILDEMLHNFSTIRCSGKKSLQMFQKGIIVSINSLKSMFQDLTTDFRLKFVLTHRLNQDVLENLFSQLRTRGGLNDHPTPLNCLYRLRMIMLGKNPGIVQSHTNTNFDSNCEFVVGLVINETGLKVGKGLENYALDNTESLISMDEPETEISTADFSKTESYDVHEQELLEIEKDALFYIAGWIAKKLRHSYPNLGNPTAGLPSHHLPSWVNQLSYGGLIEPEEGFKLKVLEFEKVFSQFHGCHINKTANVTEQLTTEICKRFPDVPKDVAEKFSRVRTFIRIKYLNFKYHEQEHLKRFYSGNKNHSQQKKKMRKLVV